MAVVIDHTNRRVLDVLESREKAKVLAYLQQGRDSGLLAHVKEVTTDMWDAYGEAVHEVFGESVAITIDRFHVMKNFQEQLSQARREIQRGLPEEQKQRLKGSRWLWLTNPENLQPEKRAELDKLKQEFPELGRLAEQREALRSIFEDPQIRDAQQGKARLQAWLEKARKLGLKALDKFCKTLVNWMDKIANYFCTRSSNGPTEGYNRGLRGILWRACGMLNFRHFRLRVLDAFGSPKT